jgi:hypothetical protein
MHLKDKLALITRGTQSISEYLQTIKSAADELALAGVPQSNDDLLLYSLRGLGSEYKEIVAAIRARDSPISFEELHDKLLKQEVYLKREASQSEPSHITANATRTYSQPKPSNNRRNEKNLFSQNRGPPHQRNQFFQGSSPHPDPRSNFKRPPPNQHNPNPIVCQYCGKRGHTARTCYQIHPPAPMANHTSIQQSPHSNWLVDSAASHHVTTDLNALSMPQDYAGSDDIVIGDGTGLEITHTGSTTLPTPSTPFTLSNVLCVPSMQNNLISVSKFCKTNKVSVEFFPAFFVVKDLRTGAPRLREQNKNDVYEWPNTVGLAAPSSIANVSIKASFRDWHNRLGHPSSKVLASVINSHSLPLLSKQPSDFLCESCNCNKSHRLPFGISTLSSSQPLELIYSDVWGPSPILSNDGFQYYVIFVDHFTKYTWLYPLRLKSDVLNVFTKFKTVVEKFFKTSILTIYSDGGGEYQKLKSFLETHGIQHLKTPPHTPQHNGSAERRHRHIVETGLTLLHNASLPLSFWSFAFQTASYLINRLPTPLLNNKSPFESLFRSPPNYSKLRIFGCLCFPWLKPYTSHKLEPKSRPCLFLGYSSSQSAYKCYDLSSKNFFYLSPCQIF